jgi:hypothetical protein
VFDDPAAVERGKFDRNAPNEMPSAMAAGEKINHGNAPVLDVLLDVLLDAAK